MKSKSILNRNYRIFEDYCNSIISKVNVPDEILIDVISSLAAFAFKCHTGLFYSSLLENRLAEIGKRNQKRCYDSTVKKLKYKFVFPSNNKRNIVHIATTLYAVGGHSSYLGNLLEMDKDSNHFLIITKQGKYKLPSYVQEIFKEKNGNLIQFEGKSHLEKAEIIRSVIHDHNEVVFLHTHPYDAVPLLAFTGEKLPRIVLFNHADHAFWLGSLITDAVVNIREEAAEICREKRNLSNTMVLPIPIKPVRASMTKVEAKQKLGIDGSKILAISMGSFYKFIPNERYDFFSTMEEVLNQNPDLLIKIIGVSNSEDLKKINYKSHSQIDLLGTIENTELYKLAADIVIDPMPYGSYTSLLEFCAFDAFPIITYSPNKLFDLTQDPALKGLILVAPDRRAYVQNFNKIISDVEWRKKTSGIIKINMGKFHSGEAWLRTYNSIFDQISHIEKKQDSTSGLFDESDSYFAELSKHNVDEVYEFLLNSIYRNARYFSFFEIIGMCRLIKNLCLGKSLWYRIKFVLSLLKNRSNNFF